ncbi:MAG: hypothetical protein GEU80_07505 [Dehalococcoidia bacterium]|nr:hypothetical protein [Dehalococcoidia bacterium]
MTSEQPAVIELLVALADPASSDREVGWAAAMAAALRVPVHLVHVLDPALGRDPVERAIAMADDLLAIAATDERWWGASVTHEVVSGLIDEELPALAAQRPGSMLVLATDDSGRLRRAMGGDWGALLRRLTTPFILLPPEVIAPRAISTAVVGLDGSDLSVRVGSIADQLATRLKLNVVRVEAIEPASTPGPEFLGAEFLGAEFLGAEPEVGGTRVRVRGRAGQTIASVARARDAGPIVVGSHGKGQMTRLLLGSTSEWLARHADRPVLIVPRGASSRH